MEPDATLKKSFLNHNVITGVLAALLVIAIGAGVYFYQKAATDPQKAAQQELQNAITAVGKLIVLPTNEMPTMAVVSDPSKLSNQPFFAHAEKGDEVLIYTISQKAILYSPTLNKIVEVAPINTTGTANIAPASSTTTTSQ